MFWRMTSVASSISSWTRCSFSMAGGIFPEPLRRRRAASAAPTVVAVSGGREVPAADRSSQVALALLSARHVTRQGAHFCERYMYMYMWSGRWLQCILSPAISTRLQCLLQHTAAGLRRLSSSPWRSPQGRILLPISLAHPQSASAVTAHGTLDTHPDRCLRVRCYETQCCESATPLLLLASHHRASIQWAERRRWSLLMAHGVHRERTPTLTRLSVRSPYRVA